MAEAAAKAMVQARLQRTALVKRMSKSHVTGGYWLGGFGEWRTVLPDHSCDLALEYRGEHWPVRWLCDNPGLSGGWRTFAIAHKLLEGDYVVFEKKSDTVLKTFLFRAADYEGGAKPEEEPFFEDASVIDFKGRKVASSIGARGGVKRGVKEEPRTGDEGAPAAKKPRARAPKKATAAAGAAAGAAAEVAGTAAGAEEGVEGPSAGAGEGSGEGQDAAADAAQPGEGVAAAAAAAATGAGAGAGPSGRRNPSRARRPEPGALKDEWQPLVTEAAPAQGRKRGAQQPKELGPDGKPIKKPRAPRKPRDPNAPPKPRAPRKPRDPNAPPPKPRAPRKPRDPNAPPPKPRAPRKPAVIKGLPKPRGIRTIKSFKRTVPIWLYKFPEGKPTEMAEILKARHASICKDGVRIDKKTETILDPYRPPMRVNGFKLNAWIHKDNRYKPIHSLFEVYPHFEREVHDWLIE